MGSCLPKDVRALTYRGRLVDVGTPVLGSVLASNQLHVARALSLIRAAGQRWVKLFGLSFKEGTEARRRLARSRAAHEVGQTSRLGLRSDKCITFTISGRLRPRQTQVIHTCERILRMLALHGFLMACWTRGGRPGIRIGRVVGKVAIGGDFPRHAVD
jgi:hypothetical protein